MLSSLQELFGSICVGLLTLFYVVHFYFHLTKLYNLDDEVKKTNRSHNGIWETYKTKIREFNTPNTTLSILFFVALYAFGQIIEDVTDNLTDGDISKIETIDSFVVPVIGPETELRASTLIENISKNSFEVKALGQHVLNNEQITSLLAKLDTLKLDTILDGKIYESDSDRDLVKNAINTIYYQSKNWCYSEPTHFQELDLIQNRIDFARSTAIISIIALILSFWLCLVQVIVKSKRSSKDSAGAKENFKWIINHNLRLLLFAALLFLFARGGYRITEKNFNERVFGYYYTHLVEKSLSN